MLKGEAMLIKERLNKDELATSTTSNDWLKIFKQTYGLRETRITGEVDENTPRHLPTSKALQHVDGLLHFSVMENDATLTGLIVEVTDKVVCLKTK